MSSPKDLLAVIQAHAAELNKPGVITIRPGFLVQDGWPTLTAAIVVVVSKLAGDIALPKEIEGIPVDVRPASEVEEFRFRDPDAYAKVAEQCPEFRGGAYPEVNPSAPEAESPAEADDETRGARKPAKTEIQYSGPTGVAMTPVTGTFPIVCHSSPDAGWPTLRDFLAGTESKLVVGMYDFTSKHILDEVKKDLAGGKEFTLTLDNPAKNPTADQTDPETVKALASTLGRDFEEMWALVRSNSALSSWIYPTAYHIKVAVRDSEAMWLSSGNWNNSNQPDIDPINHPSSQDQAIARKSDRDWHVIIEQPDLAKMYEAFLEHDFEVAKDEETRGDDVQVEAEVPDLRGKTAAQFEFHAPLRIENETITITPLLTPDLGLYQKAMLSLIQSAKQKLYIQLQYIHPSDAAADSAFTELLNAVVAKIKAGLDVRIICSEFQAVQGWLERLQGSGVDLRVVKIQTGVHNKGFVIDSKIVALGSQNWSGDGVLRNRDASVIIDNATAAAYYEKIFIHDWTNLAKQKMSA